LGWIFRGHERMDRARLPQTSCEGAGHLDFLLDKRGLALVAASSGWSSSVPPPGLIHVSVSVAVRHLQSPTYRRAAAFHPSDFNLTRTLAVRVSCPCRRFPDAGHVSAVAVEPYFNGQHSLQLARGLQSGWVLTYGRIVVEYCRTTRRAGDDPGATMLLPGAPPSLSTAASEIRPGRVPTCRFSTWSFRPLLLVAVLGRGSVTTTCFARRAIAISTPAAVLVPAAEILLLGVCASWAPVFEGYIDLFFSHAISCRRKKAGRPRHASRLQR